MAGEQQGTLKKETLMGAMLEALIICKAVL